LPDQGEEDAEEFAHAIANEGRCLMSDFSVLEAGLVMEARKGGTGGRELDLLMSRASIETVALAPEHIALAREAWRRFGKGRHAAALNIGDCCAYSLARYAGEPLLFKGRGFGRTDIEPVLTVSDLTPKPGIDAPTMVDALTNRELGVLELLAERLFDKEIAERLGISVETAKTHAKHIRQEPAVPNRRQAVTKALELGLIQDRSHRV
jgi:ribonuclease VapC